MCNMKVTWCLGLANIELIYYIIELTQLRLPSSTLQSFPCLRLDLSSSESTQSCLQSTDQLSAVITRSLEGRSFILYGFPANSTCC